MESILIVFVITIIIGFFLWLWIVFEPHTEDITFKNIKEKLRKREDLMFLIAILLLCLLITCVIEFYF